MNRLTDFEERQRNVFSVRLLTAAPETTIPLYVGATMQKRPESLLMTVIAWSLLEQPVGAYLDPGGGSMLLQILLGGFAAVSVIGKLYWHKLTSVFRRSDSEREDYE